MAGTNDFGSLEAVLTDSRILFSTSYKLAHDKVRTSFKVGMEIDIRGFSWMDPDI